MAISEMDKSYRQVLIKVTEKMNNIIWISRNMQDLTFLEHKINYF